MGYMRHHAIIVTSWKTEALEAAHRKARELFGPTSLSASEHVRVSDIIDSGMNGYHSFFVAPDGSKEGWQDSDEGDVQRDTFIAWLGANWTYDDGSTPFDWVEVQYGDDNREQRVTRASRLREHATQ